MVQRSPIPFLSPLEELAGILAAGYLRYRKRLGVEGGEKSAEAAQIPLDDVAPASPLVPEPKRLCDGGKDHEE